MIFNPNSYYHIYNHANGFDDLFKETENYRYFLQQWDKYISPLAETYAYCLMPNHIHFLIKIKDEEEVLNLGGFENLQGLERTSKIVSKKFSNLFNSYTKAFNKRYQRMGSLFMPNFKRKEIDNEKYLLNLIYYIHRNPVHHQFCKDFRDWKHSSYHALISDSPTFLNKYFITTYFEDIENFKVSHEQELNANEEYFLEK
jgi:putative transposase